MDLDIVGIGSALVDITVEVDDAFLQAESLPKGGMTLVDANRSGVLLRKLERFPKELSPGGATANVMASFAQCGGRAGFIGKVGKDEMGNYFQQETEGAGVTFIKLLSEGTPTGTGLTFITPDGQRTFATYLGAAVELSSADISADTLNRAPILHLEAYLVFNRELMDFLLRTARGNGQKISMDLSSFDTVKENLDYLERIVKDHLDIVFANEDESLAFTGLAPEDSLGVLSRLCEIAVVKEGGMGSRIARGSHKVFLPAEKIWAVDTNGAGDAYAGAVLYGLSRKMSISTCGRIGTRAGALIVGQRGARSTRENATVLRDFADELDRLMMNRLRAGALTPEIVSQIATEIAGFHLHADICYEPEKYGSVEWIEAAVDENLQQVEKYQGVTITNNQLVTIRSYLQDFLKNQGPLIDERISDQRIVACHGELHMEHICLGDKVTFLDCLEFDERFEYSDPAKDVALLVTDIDLHERSDLSAVLIDAYIEHSGDNDIRQLLPFYCVLESLIRGKFVSFRLDDQHIRQEERESVIDTARSYFELAVSYATSVSR